MEPDPQTLATSLTRFKKILIVIKGSPDPDAIASSYAMSVLCAALGISSTIVSMKKLSLPSNRAFVSILKIPIDFSPSALDIGTFDAYVVTDHQSPLIPELTEALPCAAYIDHHEPGGEAVKSDFILKDIDAGATSSLMALIIKDLDPAVDRQTMTSVATALLYGIYTDTDKYSHVHRVDYDALDYLSKFSDHAVFQKISSIPFSRKTLQLLKIATSHRVTYRDWLIAGVGYLDASHRDSIALIADFLLKRENFDTVIVYAAIEDGNGLTLDASLRSNTERINLNDIIKRITSQGGARKFKGAYQINLDYFSACPDRRLLWDLLHLSTIEQLKLRRDEMDTIEIRGLYGRLKGKVRGYFRSGDD